MKRRRGDGSKAKAQRSHAARRSREREGFRLHPARQIRAVKQIQNGEADFIERQSGRITLWWVEIDAHRLKVVYDKQRQTIVSVLPKKDRQ